MIFLQLAIYILSYFITLLKREIVKKREKKKKKIASELYNKSQ